MIKFGKRHDGTVWIIFLSEGYPYDDYYWYWVFHESALLETIGTTELTEENLERFMEDPKAEDYGIVVGKFSTEKEALMKVL